MQSYKYAERVVKKIRTLLKHNDRVKDFIGNHPSIDLDEKFQLESLVWTYYDQSLTVTSKRMLWQNRNGRAVIMAFNGFDDLLAMK